MNSRIFVLIFVVIIAVLGGYLLLNSSDNPDLGERLSDAASALSDGVESAINRLDDKSHAEQFVGDAKDTIDDAKEKITPQQ